MKNNGLNKLIKISSMAISSDQIDHNIFKNINSALSDQLMNMLSQKNGFFAFESALLVRPMNYSGSPLDIVKWNNFNTWLETYEIKIPELFFFAEDLFGGQFALSNNHVVYFDPETGDVEKFSNSIDEWAEIILDDFEVQTGYPLAHEYQKKNGPIKPGNKLIPKQLFVLGGDYEIGNLRIIDEVKGMRAMGGFASKLHDLPDGSRIEFKFTD